jgi:hypothetical protein
MRDTDIRDRSDGQAVTPEINGACSTNRRRGREDMAVIRSAIEDVLKTDRPQTVRQVFYQLVARGVIEKTEGEYQRTVIRLLTEMRLAGRIPWGWIVDESRRTLDTETFDNITDALTHTAKYYRRSALRSSDVYLEIWCEKEALSGIIWDEASEYDVPVVVSNWRAIANASLYKFHERLTGRTHRQAKLSLSIWRSRPDRLSDPTSYRETAR